MATTTRTPKPAPLAELAREAEAACAACGTTLIGPYCHACGERRARPDDESLGAFLREQFQEVTSADGRMWRTLRAVLAPGRLTVEFFRGRRGLYLRPVRLFLIVNVLFFFVLVPMGGQAFRGGAGYSRRDADLAVHLDRAAVEAGVPQEVYDAAFDQHSDTLSRTLIAVLVPLFALVFALVLLPARASAVRHVVFATHFVTALMASMIVLFLALVVFAVVWSGLLRQRMLPIGDAVLIPTLIVAIVAYLVVGVRRVYRVPWWGAGLAGVGVGTVGMMGVLEVYRVLLFYLTLWTLDVPAA